MGACTEPPRAHRPTPGRAEPAEDVRTRGAVPPRPYLTRTHPRHALHALCLAHFQCGSQRRTTPPWWKIAASLNRHAHWSSVEGLVALRLKCDGRATTQLLNQLLESFIQRDVWEDYEEILKLFEYAGVTPDDESQRLLETIKMGPNHRASSEPTTKPLAAEAPDTWITIIGDTPPLPARRAHALELSDRIAKLPDQKALLAHLSETQKVQTLMRKLVRAGRSAHAIHVANLACLVTPVPEMRRRIFHTLLNALNDQQPRDVTEPILMALRLSKDILGQSPLALANDTLRCYALFASHMSAEDATNNAQRVLLVAAGANRTTIKTLNKLKSLAMSGEGAAAGSRELQRRWDRLIALAQGLRATWTARTGGVSNNFEQDDETPSDGADPAAMRIFERVMAKRNETRRRSQGDLVEASSTAQSDDGQPRQSGQSVIEPLPDTHPAAAPNQVDTITS
ncbi:hypothetical protein CERSUDRAFT_118630 [Gelatoporia subvermispora B]|uniref:Uncharacterized protein n=1 Tax=Ceriporiopsis subvermispora (strain B) TaxID=914234 RepID=M2PAN7_CERS8|nr:hypothetical protein CERSUDRAFT_118630 [Gelatoporia subvermispora B]